MFMRTMSAFLASVRTRMSGILSISCSQDAARIPHHAELGRKANLNVRSSP